jgi:hypothetical protein
MLESASRTRTGFNSIVGAAVDRDEFSSPSRIGGGMGGAGVSPLSRGQASRLGAQERAERLSPSSASPTFGHLRMTASGRSSS